MPEDHLYRSMLLDYYGELLTARQRECFELHYNYGSRNRYWFFNSSWIKKHSTTKRKLSTEIWKSWQKRCINIYNCYIRRQRTT